MWVGGVMQSNRKYQGALFTINNKNDVSLDSRSDALNLTAFDSAQAQASQGVAIHEELYRPIPRGEGMLLVYWGLYKALAVVV